MFKKHTSQTEKKRIQNPAVRGMSLFSHEK